MKKYAFALIVVLALFSGLMGFTYFDYASILRAQTGATPTPTPVRSEDKIDRPTSNPYRGDLARFDRENRAENLQIERVMDILGVKEGKSVADIGAGGGWFTVIAARRVGEKGKVYAVDINEESKTFIDERAKREELGNIRTIVSTPDDPMLPKKSVDAVLILNTYHEVSEPIVLLKNLKKSLRKGARVGIIDRDGEGDDHGIDSIEVVAEAARAGFRLVENHDFVNATNMDYFLVFEVAGKKAKKITHFFRNLSTPFLQSSVSLAIALTSEPRLKADSKFNPSIW